MQIGLNFLFLTNNVQIRVRDLFSFSVRIENQKEDMQCDRFWGEVTNGLEKEECGILLQLKKRKVEHYLQPLF